MSELEKKKRIQQYENAINSIKHTGGPWGLMDMSHETVKLEYKILGDKTLNDDDKTELLRRLQKHYDDKWLRRIGGSDE